jgi:predicted transposase
MKLIKTVKCKLQVDKATADVLRETLNRFAECCNDIRVVAKEYKTTNKVKLQHLCYYDLKTKTFRFIEPKEEISISTHAGRKHIKLAIGNFQRGLLKGQKPKSATLTYNRNKKVFYINICLEKEVTVPSSGNPVGIDRGLYNIATTSKTLQYRHHF